MGEFKRVPSDKFFDGIAKDVGHCLCCVSDRSVFIEDGNRFGTFLDQRPKSRFVIVEFILYSVTFRRIPEGENHTGDVSRLGEDGRPGKNYFAP